MMGETDDFLMGRSLLDLCKHRQTTGKFVGDPEDFFTRVMEAAKAGTTTTKIMVTADGRALRVVDRPMTNGGWVATFEDITEQRQTEGEGYENWAFLDQIVDNVPIMLAVKDATSRRFVLVNRAAEALWGVSRTEAIGKTARELFSQAQADLIDKYDIEALRADTPLVLDAHPNMARSGDQRIVTSKRLAICDHDGKPTFLVSVVEDVTERKLVEKSAIAMRVLEPNHQQHSYDDYGERRSRSAIRFDQSSCGKYFGTSRDQIIERPRTTFIPRMPLM